MIGWVMERRAFLARICRLASEASFSSAPPFKSRGACAVDGNEDLVCYTTDWAV